MSYEPSDKELEQIVNLNNGYKLIKDGLKLIKDNLPKQDSEVEMQSYKMSKNFDKIITRIKRILERQYIDKEFLDIINNSTTSKPKEDRIKKPKKEDSKKKPVKKRKPREKK